MPDAGLNYRPARPQDAPGIVALVNAAYRGAGAAAGWTTEAHLLKGQRIDEAGICRLLETPDTMLLLCERAGELLGSVQLEKGDGITGYLGMFAVKPGSQGGGLGRCFMRAAEAKARELWGVTRMAMTVISLRKELIAYYVRRGYRPTGQTLPFPFTGADEALVAGIELAVMEKELDA